MRGFLVNALNLYCNFGTTLAFVSSHHEITVVKDLKGANTKFGITVNPDVLGLGSSHIVVASGHSVHIYEMKKFNKKESKFFQIVDCAKVRTMCAFQIQFGSLKSQFSLISFTFYRT